MVFLSPSRKIHGYCHKIGQGCSLLHPSYFIIQNYFSIWYYVTCVVQKVFIHAETEVSLLYYFFLVLAKTISSVVCISDHSLLPNIITVTKCRHCCWCRQECWSAWIPYYLGTQRTPRVMIQENTYLKWAMCEWQIFCQTRCIKKYCLLLRFRATCLLTGR